MIESSTFFMPPKAGPDRMWGKPTDIYSLGSILDIMLDRVLDRKIEHYSPCESYKMELATNYGKSVAGQSLPVSPGLVEEKHLRYLFSVMMSAEPEKRPTAREVFEYLRKSEFTIGSWWGYGTHQGDEDDDPEITSRLCGDCRMGGCCPAPSSQIGCEDF